LVGTTSRRSCSLRFIAVFDHLLGEYEMLDEDGVL
jgi:hypothetical protein